MAAMTANDELWVVPGAPLKDGSGWCVWYSQSGTGEFTVQTPSVTLLGAPVRIKSADLSLLPEVPGIRRRMGLMTLKLASPQRGEEYAISIPELEREFRWRLLPEPDAKDLTFLIASCFWLDADREGRYAAGVADLDKKEQPAFKILMGDQLYQDWWPQSQRGRTAMQRFSDRYSEYWSHPAVADVLQSSPNFVTADDHEFWNNFPDPYVLFPSTLHSAGRAEARGAAKETYFQFQQSLNPDRERFYDFDVAGVSFFVADTRSERTEYKADQRHTLSEPQRVRLRKWVAGLKGPGVLVLGQPLFQGKGGWTDRSLANFEPDYLELCGLFERALAGDTGDGKPHDILVLSGDIHTGRYSTAAIDGVPGQVHEFIASPASLVYMPTKHKVNEPPDKLEKETGPPWRVSLSHEGETPTLDNNVGLVRVRPGRNCRTRFELELWRVRPNYGRNFVFRALNWKKPQAPLRRLLHKEIELR